MIKIYLRHDLCRFNFSFILRHILKLHKSSLQPNLSDHSFPFNINRMKATNNRILVFKNHYKINHQNQHSQLHLRQLQSTKFSEVVENLQDTLMISITYDFFA